MRAPRLRGIHVIYRRGQGTALFARDQVGHYAAVSLNNNGAVRTIRTYGGMPWYGRVDFGNARRFVGGVRSQLLLERDFGNAVNVRGSLNWYALPQQRKQTRRQTNQGMNTAMTNLGIANYSATQYAAWLNLQQAQERYEWCHLISHAMGGADGPTNIVCARRGNNSEQLAIENLLSQYRTENCFQVRVRGSVLNAGNGKHMGDVICYEVRDNNAAKQKNIYLDCRPRHKPSAIHQYTLIRDLATWLNRRLEVYFGQFQPTQTEQREVRNYMADNDHVLEE
jgi:hypothetical protein